MAISLSAYKKYGAKASEAERQAEVFKKQQAKARRRGGFAGLLGQVFGGIGGSWLAGLGGPLLAPLLMGLGKFGGKQLGYEMTKGMAADPSKIKAEGKYGFGKEGAKTLREELEAQQVQDPSKVQGGLGADILGSYLSAGLEKGWEGLSSQIGKKGSLIPVKPKSDIESVLTSGEIDASEILDGSRVTSEVTDLYGESEEYDDTAVSEELDLAEIYPGYKGEQGGLVQNKPPTIADFFGMHGKTLGGSNKQSIAEILGKK